MISTCLMLAFMEVIFSFCLWASEAAARVLAVLTSGTWAFVDYVPNILGNQVGKHSLHRLVMSSR